MHFKQVQILKGSNNMAYSTSKSVRFHEDLEVPKRKPQNPRYPNNKTNKPNGSWAYSTTTGSKMSPHLTRVFSEEYDALLDVRKNLFDPRGPRIHRWNKIFLMACLVSLFVDPLFFYLPIDSKMGCIKLTASLEVVLTVIRSLVDVFYFVQIYAKFRTAFVAPSSRVFGRGELIIEPSEIAFRYVKRTFWLDLLAALPLPQFLIWVVVPLLKEATVTNRKNLIRFSIMIQYFPRLFLIFPLMKQIVMATGVMTETAWAGAAYNLMLYMLVSHLLGSVWYLLSVERQEACWKEVCRMDGSSCQYAFFDCKETSKNRHSWYQSSNVTSLCNPDSTFYQFGIYAEALNVNLTSAPFIQKYIYCFWWGLKNLSCLGQNLATSTNVGEITFAIVIAVLGLVLFGLLIGNMQSYLQSTMVRLEEWRLRRRDMEQWMQHRQLPPELKQRVRRYHQYQWVTTRGVNEETLLKDLPIDLRRDIKRHLCLDLVREVFQQELSYGETRFTGANAVPLFDEMDERMLEAICERLKPALFTKGTCIIRELDPVDSMLFIIRGYLDSCTTQGGRSGFFNCCRMGPGEFCGEELLTWALNPHPSAALPRSTRTVRALSQVEAFALVSDDLKFVASQFRRLHSKELRHKFRQKLGVLPELGTLGSPEQSGPSSRIKIRAVSCIKIHADSIHPAPGGPQVFAIHATWRQQKRRRSSIELRLLEGESVTSQKPQNPNNKGEAGVVDVFSGKVVTNRRNSRRSTVHLAKSLKKPTEPDFTIEEESWDAEGSCRNSIDNLA